MGKIKIAEQDSTVLSHLFKPLVDTVMWINSQLMGYFGRALFGQKQNSYFSACAPRLHQLIGHLKMQTRTPK